MTNIFSIFKSKKSTTLLPSIADLEQARLRVRQVLEVSPLVYSAGFSTLAGHEIFLKCDNRLMTGSFKERGAVNVLLGLNDKQKKSGVCAASLGNHALALSYHASKLGIPCLIVMPKTAPLVKIQRTRNTGAKVELYGQYFDEAYDYAIKLASDQGLHFVSAFDDLNVICGQATAGLEMLDQLADFDSVIVPVGGGGLISGIATAIKLKRPEVFVLGVRSEWTVEGLKLAQQKIKQALPAATIADGIAVKKEGKISVPIMQEVVNQFVSISEAEIANAVVRFLEIERTLVEGAGAAGIAALLKQALPKQYKKTIVEISGSNIDMNILARLIERDMGERQRLLRINVSVPDRPGSLNTITEVLAANGANVLQVQHDRSFSSIPSNVNIMFVMEVRDEGHKNNILKALGELGVAVSELNSN